MKEVWEKIEDLRYKKGMKVSELVDNFGHLGFQSIQIGKAVEVIKEMKKDNAKIVFTFTSNMVTSGLRGLFAQLIEKKFVDVVITTVGSIEEDFIKSFGNKFVIGEYNINDTKLSAKGLNRVGNIYIPTDVYIDFEKRVRPILEKMYAEKKIWTSREVIQELGKNVTDKNSILYQATKNNVPIHCPAIMDGALGIQLASFQMEHKDFQVDCVNDLNTIINQFFDFKKIGCIVLGGGVPKHYAILSSILRDGMDYAVYITTASPYSGSASGASTDEAKSWGKLKGTANAITVRGEASVVFPLVIFKVLDDLSNETKKK